MKHQLRFLVEDYLEKSGKEITARIAEHRDAAKTMWEQLEGILFYNSFWMDEIDNGDMAEIDYEKLLMEYHAFLKPIWQQFREALFKYKYGIIPAREELQKEREHIDHDLSSPISKYKELLKQTTALDLEKFHDITLTVSFEPGHVTFYKRSMNVIKNLMDLLSGVDIKYFAKCEHCGKCIFVSRLNKRFHPGCAAKKYQKDKWQQDPEGMRKSEKVRYRERRKKS